MIHLPTAAGGEVTHLVRLGQIVRCGDLITRVQPEDGPIEELVAPLDGVVERLRLAGQVAPQHAQIVGITRLVLSSCVGRLRWIATLGPVGLTTMVALIETADGAIRPHRAGGSGFVGRRFAEPGDRIEVGAPLIEIRGEELG